MYFSLLKFKNNTFFNSLKFQIGVKIFQKKRITKYELFLDKNISKSFTYKKYIMYLFSFKFNNLLVLLVKNKFKLKLKLNVKTYGRFNFHNLIIT